MKRGDPLAQMCVYQAAGASVPLELSELLIDERLGIDGKVRANRGHHAAVSAAGGDAERPPPQTSA